MRRIALAVCLLCVLVSSSSIAQVRPRITGFFSDMRLNGETGDVLGTEIWIVYARNRYWATVQMAEGSPERPVVVPVEVTGSRIRFVVPMEVNYGDGSRAPDLMLVFEGRVTGVGLTGKFNGNPITLKRSRSYWE